MGGGDWVPLGDMFVLERSKISFPSSAQPIHGARAIFRLTRRCSQCSTSSSTFLQDPLAHMAVSGVLLATTCP